MVLATFWKKFLKHISCYWHHATNEKIFFSEKYFFRAKKDFNFLWKCKNIGCVRVGYKSKHYTAFVYVISLSIHTDDTLAVITLHFSSYLFIFCEQGKEIKRYKVYIILLEMLNKRYEKVFWYNEYHIFYITYAFGILIYQLDTIYRSYYPSHNIK